MYFNKIHFDNLNRGSRLRKNEFHVFVRLNICEYCIIICMY